jgi:hypothetical protein
MSSSSSLQLFLAREEEEVFLAPPAEEDAVERSA